MPDGKNGNEKRGAAAAEAGEEPAQEPQEKSPAPQQKAGQQPQQQKPPDEAKERFLRLAAEFDNYKKRARADMEGAKSMGKFELMKGMLPVLDEFELAMAAAAKSEDKALARGIEMLYSNLMETLRRSGLREVKADGASDPYRHEILMTMESEKREGTILEVVKKGYLFGEMLLRPAAVIVSKPASAVPHGDGAKGGNTEK